MIFFPCTVAINTDNAKKMKMHIMKTCKYHYFYSHCTTGRKKDLIFYVSKRNTCPDAFERERTYVYEHFSFICSH